MSVNQGADLSQSAPLADRVGTRQLFPCTPAQRRFWLLDQMEPGNPALNVAVRWQLDGPVTHDQIAAAWQGIVDRHEILRSFFASIGGELRQIAEPGVRFTVSHVDLTGVQPTGGAVEVERLGAAEARRPFSLGMAPLLRVTSLRIAPQRTILLVTAHHIVCDGWSIGILADEMLRLLASPGSDAHRAEPPLQYGEYATWLNDTVAATPAAASLDYWGDTLRGMRQFELIADHPRPRQQTSNGQIASVLLDRGLTGALAGLAVRESCSLYVAALAALLVLLVRHDQQTDIAIGTQLAGRDDVELEQVVGVFINTVVLRCDLEGVESFRALLGRVGARVSEAIAHADVPFEAVLEALRPPRDPSRNPLFSINFIFQRSFVSSARIGELALTDLPSISAGALYDLNFFMVERPEGWRFSCEYNTDLFDAATVEGLVGRFPVLLGSIVATPDQPIAALELLGAPERRWLLSELNATAAPPPPQRTVPKMFAAQVARRPDATAVVCGPRAVSYGALAQAAEGLASALIARGIGSGARVGILLDRSVDLVVALLGVLGSGAAYVPLDPSYPPARLRRIAEDAGLAALVSDSPTQARLQLPVDAVILLDEKLAEVPPRAVHASFGADTAAYVIYTSGSTGLPKGVEIGHHALANLIWSMRDTPGLDTDDVLLGVTTVSFDIAALEIFLPLAVGATLVLAGDDEKSDGAALWRLLRRHRVTTMQATPVTWRLLLEAGWRGDPALRMLCGGEALTRGLADALLACGGEVWNMYGPTETTIWSAALRVRAGDQAVPIGGPIANTQLHVLDRAGQLVPPGAPGELYIGGDGVAFGYLGQPALTAERFVPDPFRPGAGRLYRTGDVVRRRADGTLDFLGRVDHQVKLRGFRIELGAIEACLLECAEIAECVVVAAAASTDTQTAAHGAVGELWAYLAPHRAPADPESVVATVRAFLAARLPAYMVPARLVMVPALPRTPNGKIDRAALAVPATALPGRAAAPSEDDLDARVGSIWCRALGVEALQPSSDFFDLGGNSLTAARMLAEVNTAFERALRPSIMFRHPSFGAFTDMLRRPSDWDFDFSEVVQLQPQGSRPTLIALNNTGVFYRLARRLGTSQPFVALQLFDPALRRHDVPDDFQSIADEYVKLILQAQPRGPYALIGWCVAGSLAFEVAHQLSEAGRQVCLVVIIDGWAPGFSARQNRIASMLTHLSLRVQTIARDIGRVVRGTQSLDEFIDRRRLLRRWLRRDRSPHARTSEDEQYHAWILERLTAAARRHHPADYAGRVLLLRARHEPAGPFIDRQLGWARHATGHLSIEKIDGDHSSIFSDPGLQQMADRIAEAMTHQGYR